MTYKKGEVKSKKSQFAFFNLGITFIKIIYIIFCSLTFKQLLYENKTYLLKQNFVLFFWTVYFLRPIFTQTNFCFIFLEGIFFKSSFKKSF